MCGIAGWHSLRPCRDGDRWILRRMMDLQAHRGPDDSGMLLEGPVRLGHSRLSIIDLESGHQPMLDSTGKRAIIYNGEIYNFRELRENLSSEGYHFKTKSDTEVVLETYGRFGDEFLQHLNGMFAFALWDGTDSRLILARDRLGIKPLYYTVLNDGSIVFASEKKAILAFPGIRREPNLEALSSYLSFRTVLGSETIFKGIHLLEPGCYLEIVGERMQKHRYWSLPREKYESVSIEECFDKTEALLEKSVKGRLISDVPIGAFLSGGLDSSALVAMMSEMMDEPIKTYSVGFPEEDYNELEYSRKVASIFGTDHHEIVLDEGDYLDRLHLLIRLKDEPLAVANEIALYELSKFLKKDITVVLSGEGADELFVGYGRIFRSPYDYERLSANGDNRQGQTLRDQVKQYCGKDSFKNEIDHFLSRYQWLDAADKEEVFTREAWEAVGRDQALVERLAGIFSSVRHFNHYDKYLYFFQRFHLENLLRRVDTTTMANSVEARVPFVDHELVEHVFRLPFGEKLRWKSKKDKERAQLLASDRISEVHDTPKYVLKKLMEKKLPEQIIYRNKMGFPVPLDRYFRSSFFEYSKRILCDAAAERRGLFDTRAIRSLLDRHREACTHADALKVWMLVNVEVWFRLYFDEVRS